MTKRRNKKLTIAVVIVIILLGAGIYAYDLLRPVKFGVHQPVVLTSENLPGYLSRIDLIQDLPEDSDIQVNFGGNKYSITGGVVRAGALEDPEVVMDLPEEYIGRIGEVGLCQATGEAVRNREISVETKLSEAELAWRYKKLLRYRECVGI